MSENLFLGDTTYPHTTDRQRADALAAVIHDLKKIVTADHETKEAFIDRVKNVLSADPDLRVSELHNRIEELEAAKKNMQFFIDNLKRINSDIEAQLENARTDQARYQWLRSQHWNESNLCVVMHPKEAVRFGHDCPSQKRLDDIIDEAIKEQGK